jgi:hypothetical protein
MFALLEEARFEALKPDAFNYTSVLLLLCNGGEVELATNFLKDLKRALSFHGNRPDIQSYIAIINAMGKTGRVDGKLNTFMKTVKKDLLLNPNILEYLEQLCQKHTNLWFQHEKIRKEEEKEKKRLQKMNSNSGTQSTRAKRNNKKQDENLDFTKLGLEYDQFQ